MQPNLPSARFSFTRPVAENTGHWGIVALSGAMLASSLGTSIANVALPSIANAYSAAFQDVQWVVLAYLLATTALIVSAGRLGDAIGRRNLLLAGIAVFVLGSLLSALSPVLPMLIAARLIQGAGAAVMMALSVAMVGETVPKARAGWAMGLLGTSSAIGTALGPSLGGALLSGAGWTAIFFGSAAVGVAILALAAVALPRNARQATDSPASIDLPGALLLAATLAAYALAMTVGRGHYGSANAGLFVLAMIGAGLFVLVEARRREPLVRLSMLRNPDLRAGLATSALIATVVMATLVVGPFHLSKGLGLDQASVGLAMSVGPAVAALVGVPAGRLVDRFGTLKMASLGLAGVAAGCVGIVAAPVAAGVWGYIVPLAVLTASYALFQAANNTAVMADVTSTQRGLISGLLGLSRNLGLITGASVIGAVFAIATGAPDAANAASDATLFGTRIAFLAAFGLAMLAWLIARRARHHPQ